MAAERTKAIVRIDKKGKVRQEDGSLFTAFLPKLIKSRFILGQCLSFAGRCLTSVRGALDLPAARQFSVASTEIGAGFTTPEHGDDIRRARKMIQIFLVLPLLRPLSLRAERIRFT